MLWQYSSKEVWNLGYIYFLFHNVANMVYGILPWKLAVKHYSKDSHSCSNWYFAGCHFNFQSNLIQVKFEFWWIPTLDALNIECKLVVARFYVEFSKLLEVGVFMSPVYPISHIASTVNSWSQTCFRTIVCSLDLKCLWSLRSPTSLFKPQYKHFFRPTSH